MAAALGDRAAIVEHLDKAYRDGAAVPAWMALEPLMKRHAGDKAVAAALEKHADRRAQWRRQLAAEGL